ncbi:anaphase promoting complex subunit 8 [Cokeromyces recurvatus]|uniref:anaphase promoting complex subunit 8 n=1 Tax=Cokeromyces recurvatus TaxID=90255 RepID=UPI00221EED92|nr:anaphase promoting complex subunit 8 [Cokeromyces recurvatus]KAI7905498.1 anaphase promoting complex subunit 8 [Cokeromyces recurvatus]
MVITSEAIRSFKVQLQQAVIICSERCLFNSAKWACEILDGIKDELLDTKIPFTNNDVHLKVVSTYHTDYESSLPPLSEYEYNKYQFAKTLFQMRQFDRVRDVLGDSKSSKLYFLRLYARYLSGEKHKEELTQDILNSKEDNTAENPELNSIYEELSEDYEKDNLDAFTLYLYGIVLKRRKSSLKAATVLLKSIQAYEFNWSAWMELASLIENRKMFIDIQNLLNRNFRGSIMKNLFFTKLCIDLYQPIELFRTFMSPLHRYFPNSAYILSQCAILFYDNMEYNESLYFFEELRRLHPSRLEDMDIYSNLLHLRMAKDKLCILALECDRIDKYTPEACCVKANYYNLKGEIPESIEYFKRALKLNRSYLLAWILLGHDYIELKDTSVAIECYRRAISIDNRDYRAWYGLGQAFEVRKLPNEAVYYYQKATDFRPTDARMWKVLATCYGALGRGNDVEYCNRKAIICEDEVDSTATIQLGRIFQEMGKIHVAIPYYHKIWEQSNKLSNITDELAEISICLAKFAVNESNFSEAKKYANTALNSRYPYHEEARQILDRISENLH